MLNSCQVRVPRFTTWAVGVFSSSFSETRGWLILDVPLDTDVRASTQLTVLMSPQHPQAALEVRRHYRFELGQCEHRLECFLICSEIRGCA